GRALPSRRTDSKSPSLSTTRLLCTGLAALLLQGCATTMRRPPSRADSAFAVIALDGVLEDYSRFLLSSRPDLSARVSNFITALPDPTLDRAKKDAQFARAAMSGLDDISIEALSEDDYVTWMSLRWEMEALAGWPAFHWTRLDD